MLIVWIFFSLFFPLYVGGDWLNDFRFMQVFFWLFALLISSLLYSVSGWISSYCVLKLPQDALGAALRSKAIWLKESFTIVLIFCAFILTGTVNSAQQDTKRVRAVPGPALPLEGNAVVHREFKRLSSHLGISNPLLLVPDIGAVVYYGGFRVLDIARLADPLLAQEKDLMVRESYIFVERRPDFMWVHGTWAKRPELSRKNLKRYGYTPLRRSAYFKLRRGGASYIRNDLFSKYQELRLKKNSAPKQLRKLDRPVFFSEAHCKRATQPTGIANSSKVVRSIMDATNRISACDQMVNKLPAYNCCLRTMDHVVSYAAERRHRGLRHYLDLSRALQHWPVYHPVIAEAVARLRVRHAKKALRDIDITRKKVSGARK